MLGDIRSHHRPQIRKKDTFIQAQHLTQLYLVKVRDLLGKELQFNAALISKTVAEAVYCVGVIEKDLGICVRIADGNGRATYPIVIHALKQLGILDNSKFEALRKWYYPSVRNNLGNKVGEIIPIFTLDKPLENPVVLGKRLQFTLDLFIS